MSLQSLEPDFAIGVKHLNVAPQDEKARKAASNDDSNLELLFSTLEEYGFKAQVRAGADPATQLLVFVKIVSATYEELVKKDLLRNHEFGLTDNDSAPYNRQRLIYEYLTTPRALGGVGISPGVGVWNFVESITSLDGYLADPSVTEQAKQQLVDPTFSSAKFNVAYGPGVALFFDFVRFYTLGLVGLSLFGIIGFLKSKNYSIAFSFINLIWATGFLVLWRRRAKFLSNTWGVQGALDLERFRSNLAGASGEVQDSKQMAESDKIRFIKQLLFVPVALAFGAVLLTAQGLCFVLEIFILEIYDGPGKAVLTLTPTILLSTFVPVFTIIYSQATQKFIDWEQHKSNLTRSQSFAIKSFLLNIMTGYVPLLISAFIYLPFAHLLQPNLVYIKRAISGRIRSDRYAYSYLTNIKTLDSFEINQGRLDSQYFYFIVTNQVIGSVLKFGLPLILTPAIEFVKKIISGKKTKFEAEENPEEKLYLDRVRKASALPEYSVDDSFRDIALQFGYVAVFGSIWTLAPLVCIFFNILTFKLEEWRVASGHYFKPVVARKIDTIYPWNIAFFFLAWLGSIVSPLVASFYRHGAKPPKHFGSFGFDKASVNVGSTIGLVTVLLLSEHLFFALYFIGGRLSDLYKSEVEAANDNFQNTLVLRRQQFSQEGFPQIASPDDSAWSSYAPSGAIKQVKSLGVHEVEIAPEVEKSQALSEPQGQSKSVGESVSDTLASVGALTGISRLVSSDDSSVTNKKELLEKKRRELERLQEIKRRELEERAEHGDSIVDTVDPQGKSSQAIMDDNSHVPNSGTDYEKNIDTDAAAARALATEEGTKEGTKGGLSSKAAPAAAGGAAGGAAVGGAGAAAASLNKKDSQDTLFADKPLSNDPSAALNKEHILQKSAERLGVAGKEGTVAPVPENGDEKRPVATEKEEGEGENGAEAAVGAGAGGAGGAAAGGAGGAASEAGGKASGLEEKATGVDEKATGSKEQASESKRANGNDSEKNTQASKNSSDTRSTDTADGDEKKSSRKKSLKNLLKRK